MTVSLTAHRLSPSITITYHNEVHADFISRPCPCGLTYLLLPETEAKKSVHSSFADLLPVAAQVNLSNALEFPRLREMLHSCKEVAINLDQDVFVQASLIV